jgi:hypothetical protein
MHAMRAGATLVRVHYRDVQTGSGMRLAAHIMQQPTADVRGPLLVLSSTFNLSDPTNTNTIAKQRVFVSELKAALRAAGFRFTVRHDAMKQIWIQAVPPTTM